MIHVDRSSDRPLFEQIYAHYVDEILGGRITRDTILTPTRKLAEELGVSRNTVMKAYEQLEAEGYIEAYRGSGYRVLDIPVLEIKDNSPNEVSRELDDKQYRYDFIYGSLDNDDFPYTKWLECYREAVYGAELRRSTGYSDNRGEYSLRREICRYLYRARGADVSPDQVVVSNGLQYVMEMICNMMKDREKKFAMEDPGYDGIREVMINRGYEIIPVPVGDSGIDTSYLKDIDASLLYLTPSNQFPLGGVLPVADRLEVIAWAEEKDAYIVEDDYYSELRYYTNPVPSIKSMDFAGRVIYTGTFSKSLSPEMRITYAVLPPELLKNFDDYYHRYHSNVSGLHERALALFMEKGYYDKHINRIRTKYRKKMDMLLSSIDEVFGDTVRVIGGEAGIHLLIKVRSGMTQEEMISLAQEKGIRIYPTRQFYHDREGSPDDLLLIGFPTVPVERFVDVFTELKEIWRLG